MMLKDSQWAVGQKNSISGKVVVVESKCNDAENALSRKERAQK